MESIPKEASSGFPLERAVKILLILFVVSTIALVAFYVNERYRHQNVSLIDRETQRREEFVRRDPDSATARLAVADAYLVQKQYAEAIQQYEEVHRGEPDRVGALIGLGLAYRGKGDTARMTEYFNRVIELNTGDFAQFDRRMQLVYYYLGQAYLQQGETDKAVEQFQAGLKIRASDSDLLFLLGNAYQAKGEHDMAVAAYGRATQFVPDFVEAYQAMATSFEKMSDTARAKYARGMVAFSRQDYPSAVRQLEEAAAQAPDDPILLYGLGMAREKVGQKEQAVDAYRNVLALSPGYRMAQDGLARLGAN